MGQINAERIQTIARKQITSAINDDAQTVNSTTCFKVGDVVDLILVDEHGCVSGIVQSGLTVSGVCPGASFVFDAPVDTSAPPAGFSYYVENRELNDAQEMFDRLCECYTEPQVYPFTIAPGINAQSLNDPIGGQATYTLESDALCFDTGDTVQIICAEGIAGDAIVVSRNISNGTITLDESIDLTAFTDCKMVNTSLTLAQIIGRLKDLISDIPVCNECLDEPDCDNTAYEVDSLFIVNSSKVYQDGARLKKTDCGTRASLTTGAGDSELSLTSMVLGLRGNNISFEMLDPAAANSPLSVTVTGNIDDGTKLISVSLETDGGSSIISTAQDVADLLNSDAETIRLVQAIWGGTGLGVVSATASAPLTGGLNDYAEPGDYCELEQVQANSLTGGGYKWISLWIMPDTFQHRNRKHSAPRDDEELCIDYRSSV